MPESVWIIVFSFLYPVLLFGSFIIFGWGMIEVALELFRNRGRRGIIFGPRDGIGSDMAIHFDSLQKGPMIACSNCDEMVPEKHSTCVYCGETLRNYSRTPCPTCNLSVPSIAKFCRFCGEEISPPKKHPSDWR